MDICMTVCRARADAVNGVSRCTPVLASATMASMCNLHLRLWLRHARRASRRPEARWLPNALAPLRHCGIHLAQLTCWPAASSEYGACGSTSHVPHPDVVDVGIEGGLAGCERPSRSRERLLLASLFSPSASAVPSDPKRRPHAPCSRHRRRPQALRTRLRNLLRAVGRAAAPQRPWLWPDSRAARAQEGVPGSAVWLPRASAGFLPRRTRTRGAPAQPAQPAQASRRRLRRHPRRHWLRESCHAGLGRAPRGYGNEAGKASACARCLPAAQVGFARVYAATGSLAHTATSP